MRSMTDLELLKYAMMTSTLTGLLISIFEFLQWLCRKMDEEEKENKKNKENKENKPSEKEPK